VTTATQPDMMTPTKSPPGLALLSARSSPAWQHFTCIEGRMNHNHACQVTGWHFTQATRVYDKESEAMTELNCVALSFIEFPLSLLICDWSCR
jgi:hypothetical protein